MQKLYCYVDETGLDVGSNNFIVSVVIAEEYRDDLLKSLEEIEVVSGKGKVKWIESRHQTRMDYIRKVLSLEQLVGKIYFSVYPDRKDYLPLTVLTTARAY